MFGGFAAELTAEPASDELSVELLVGGVTAELGAQLGDSAFVALAHVPGELAR